jgi:hypothetical protein
MSNFIHKLREKVALYKLNGLLKKSPRQKHLHNLKSAGTAGILYDATKESHHAIVKNLIKN